MKQNNLPILCIEDDEDTCNLVTFVFEQEGYKVEACSRTDCLKLIHEEKFAAVILDNYFIETSGVSICQELRSFDKTTPVIFFSGESRQSEIDKALAAGANVYLVKPNDFQKLVPTAIRLIEGAREAAV
jgi:DNA-binding response OmpR family regulator